jgi:hypothetical protein
MPTRIFCYLPLLALLTACALGDTPSSPTPAPPITLAPPPTLTFSGNCESTPELDHWLQTTSFLAADFLTLVNDTAALDRGQMYEPVLRMAALRDQVSLTATPDCAQVVQELLNAAMNVAVDTFQAFANGESTELGTTVAQVSDQLETVMAMQQELIARLEAQYRAEQAQP